MRRRSLKWSLDHQEQGIAKKISEIFFRVRGRSDDCRTSRGEHLVVAPDVTRCESLTSRFQGGAPTTPTGCRPFHAEKEPTVGAHRSRRRSGAMSSCPQSRRSAGYGSCKSSRESSQSRARLPVVLRNRRETARFVRFSRRIDQSPSPQVRAPPIPLRSARRRLSSTSAALLGTVQLHCRRERQARSACSIRDAHRSSSSLRSSRCTVRTTTTSTTLGGAAERIGAKVGAVKLVLTTRCARRFLVENVLQKKRRCVQIRR